MDVRSFNGPDPVRVTEPTLKESAPFTIFERVIIVFKNIIVSVACLVFIVSALAVWHALAEAGRNLQQITGG